MCRFTNMPKPNTPGCSSLLAAQAFYARSKTHVNETEIATYKETPLQRGVEQSRVSLAIKPPMLPLTFV
jgi:hypothetical protein